MIGRELIDREQSEALVIQALRDTILDSDFDVDEWENPKLVEDLGIDEFVLADLVESLEREFEITVCSEEAETWRSFRDVVTRMMELHNEYVDEEIDMGDNEDEDDD